MAQLLDRLQRQEHRRQSEGRIPFTRETYLPCWVQQRHTKPLQGGLPHSTRGGRLLAANIGRNRQPPHRHDVLSGTQHHPEQEHSPCGYDQQGPTAHTRILGERPHHTEDSRRPGGKLLIVPQTLQGVYRHRSCHVSARSPTAKS